MRILTACFGKRGTTSSAASRNKAKEKPKSPGAPLPAEPSQFTEKSAVPPRQPPSTTTAVFLLLGRCGSGKTSFIEKAVSEQGHVRSSTHIQNTSTAATSSAEIDGQKLKLIDTPGFDNSVITNLDAFTRTAEHLLNESDAKTGLSGVIYIHPAGDPVQSRTLAQNFGVISDVFLGESGLSRLVILVVPTQPGTSVSESTVEALTRTGAFREACAKGAQVIPLTLEKKEIEDFLYSHASQEPTLLRIQQDPGRSLTIIRDEIEERLGYYEKESHRLRLEERTNQTLAPFKSRIPLLEAALKEKEEEIARYSNDQAQTKQQLARSREETAAIQQKHQQTQKEYASLRSQLQLQENIEQGEIVQILKDLNRDIDDIGRAISEHLVDNHIQKTFNKDAADITALDARHLPELAALLEHVEGSSSIIASSSGAGMSIEDFFDYASRSLLCKHLCKRIFQPFHPAIDSSKSDFLTSMYHDIQQRDSQAAAAKWRANSFKSAFNSADVDETNRHIDTITQELTRDTLAPLITYVFGQEAGVAMENQHLGHLARLVRTAWDWNSMLKGEVIMLGDFHQTYYPPLHSFDTTLMSEFEPNSKRPQAKSIIGTLALGLTSSKAVGGGRAPEITVVYKATVATEGLYE